MPLRRAIAAEMRACSESATFGAAFFLPGVSCFLPFLPAAPGFTFTFFCAIFTLPPFFAAPPFLFRGLTIGTATESTSMPRAAATLFARCALPRLPTAATSAFLPASPFLPPFDFSFLFCLIRASSETSILIGVVVECGERIACSTKMATAARLSRARRA